MRKQLKGYVRINASGRSIYSFINLIHSSHIRCFSQYCSNDVFYADIYRSDLKKLTGLAEKCGVSLKYAEYDTLRSRLHRYRLRAGLIVGALAVFVMSVYFSNVVVTIDVLGNSQVSDSDVIAALAGLGVKKGTPIGSIDFDRCAVGLRLNVEGISWAGLRHTGNRLVVELTEIVPKPEMVNEHVPCNVVASEGARITSTSVYDGQLMHKVGDYVPAGALLISGVVSDDAGHTTLHHAMGKITGIYTQTVTFDAPRSTVINMPTGRTDSSLSLDLFNLSIPLSIGRHGYSSQQTSAVPDALCLFGRELPLGVTRYTYTETKLSAEEYSDKELEEILDSKIFLYEKNFLSSGTNIVSRKIVPRKTDTGLAFDLTYEIEGDICEQHEIWLKPQDSSPGTPTETSPHTP